MFQNINRVSKRFLSFIVDDVRLLHFGFIFFGVILTLSCLYYVLTPYSNGIGYAGSPIDNLSFFDALYFSVVTVSSLGYGDMHPMGYSKLLAVGEVLFGLAIMGIMIAKLTSSRISHHVSRLYKNELQKRLEEYSSDFKMIETSLLSSMKKMGEFFQDTPTSTPKTDSSIIVQECSSQLMRFNLHTIELKEYITEESDKGAFFGVAPLSTLQKTAEAIDQSLFVLGQLVTSLSPEAKTIVLNKQNRQHTSTIMETVENLAEFVVGNCKHAEVRRTFSQLIQRCSEIPESFYIAPEITTEIPPDQQFTNDDEPQP